jgi:hypothetical protein
LSLLSATALQNDSVFEKVILFNSYKVSQERNRVSTSTRKKLASNEEATMFAFMIGLYVDDLFCFIADEFLSAILRDYDARSLPRD